MANAGENQAAGEWWLNSMGERYTGGFHDAVHPTAENGQCPSCYSEGYEDAEKVYEAKLTAARQALEGGNGHDWWIPCEVDGFQNCSTHGIWRCPAPAITTVLALLNAETVAPEAPRQ